MWTTCNFASKCAAQNGSRLFWPSLCLSARPLRAACGNKARHEKIRGPLRRRGRPAARQWLAAAKAHTLIHGHTHKPAEHDLGDGFSRVVLSDWDAQAPVPRADVLRLTASGLQRIAL